MSRTELSGEEIFDSSLTEADMSGSILDGTPSTPSLRTLGTGSSQAAAGDAFNATSGTVNNLTQVEYVVISTDATLQNERVLSGGIGVNLVDGGAGGSINVDLTLQGNGDLSVTTGSGGILILSASENTDQAVRVSSDDTTTSYLDDKFVVTGAGISKTTLSPGGNEQLQVSIATAIPLTLTPDLSNAEGSSSSLARSDHIHNVPADTPSSLGAGRSNLEGVSSSFARSDHVHRIDDPTFFVSATNIVATTSAVFTPVPDMTITPGVGTYIATVSTYGVLSANNATGYISFYVNSTFQDNTLRVFGGTSQSDFQKFPLQTQVKFVLTGSSETLSARYRVLGGGSILLKERSLIVQRVDS